jgi:hypothetical protein
MPSPSPSPSPAAAFQVASPRSRSRFLRFVWLGALLALLVLDLWALVLAARAKPQGATILLAWGHWVLPATLRSWVLIGIAGLGGLVANAAYDTARHGFILKDFDPAAIPYQVMRTVIGLPITLIFFALGDLVLPGELLPGGNVTDNARVLGVAFLLGYFSELAFSRLYDAVKGWLRGPAGLPLDLGYGKVVGIDLPTTVLGRLVEQAGKPEKVLPHLPLILDRLARKGYTYTHTLLGALGSPQGAREFAGKNDLDPDAVELFYRFADLTRVEPDFLAAAERLDANPRLTGEALLGEALAPPAPGALANPVKATRSLRRIVALGIEEHQAP